MLMRNAAFLLPLRGGSGFDENEPLTYEEKRNLRLSIEKLPEDKATKAIKIIQDAMELGRVDEEGEVEIDIDSLPTATLRQLQKFVSNAMGVNKGQVSHGPH